MVVSCQICLGNFSANNPSKTPRCLRCGHAFCQGCLEGLIKNRRIQCPYRCSKLTKVPSNGIEGIPKNYSLLEVLSLPSLGNPSLQHLQHLENDDASSIYSAESFDGMSTESGFTGAGGAPALIGRYQVRSLLAKGSFGDVFECLDPKMGRKVAVKRAHPQFRGNEKIKQRALKMMRSLAAVSHSSIIAVYDCDESSEGDLFIVMELFKGKSLKQKMKRHIRLETSLTASILKSVCLALEAAHAMGVVHSDLKPSHVLIGKHGEVKVIGFGMDSCGIIGGRTMDDGKMYLSPEQMQQQRSRAASMDGSDGSNGFCDMTFSTDIWQMGVMALHLVTGVVQSAVMTREMAVSILSEFDITGGIAQVITRSLSPEPSGRYSSMVAFRKALENCCNPSEEKSTDPSRRRKSSGDKHSQSQEAAEEVAAVLNELSRPAAGDNITVMKTFVHKYTPHTMIDYCSKEKAFQNKILLERLLVRATDQSPAVARYAMATIVLLSRSDANKEALVEKNGIATTISILKNMDKNPNVAHQCCRLLSNLSMDTKFHSALISAGSIESTLKVISSYSHAALLETAVKTLINLTTSEAQIDGIVNGNGIETTVTMMGSNQESVVLERACTLLTTLAAAHKTHKRRICQAGGVVAITNAMNTYIGCRSLQEEAISALTTLSIHPEVAIIIANNRCVSLTSKTMLAHRCSLIVQERGTEFLSNLAAFENLTPSLIKDGAITTVLQAMEANERHTPLLEAGCRFLVNMLQYAHQEIVKSKAPIVVQRIKTVNPLNKNIQRMASRIPIPTQQQQRQQSSASTSSLSSLSSLSSSSVLLSDSDIDSASTTPPYANLPRLSLSK